jgi:hypothetical protein
MLLRRIYQQAIKQINSIFPLEFECDNSQKADLLIIDNIFPNPISDWRYIEFTEYLRAFQKVCIYTGVIENNKIFVPKDYLKHKELYVNKLNLDHASWHTIKALNVTTNIAAKLGYCLFYYNLTHAFPIFHRYRIPFAFTLYPGGRFSIYDVTVRDSLIKYVNSPLFRHLFVNMPNIYDYALQQLGLPEEKVTLVYGVPISAEDSDWAEIQLCRFEQSILNVCFAAYSYMHMGLSKGFDVFCRLAKLLEGFNDIKFFVIGGHSESDSFFKYHPNVNFLGELSIEQMDRQFEKMHIVVSPVRSHVFSAGCFDGFPTGAALRAILNGCVYVGTDPEDNAQALGLIHDEHLLLTSDRTSDIAEKILILRSDRKKMYEMALAGQDKFAKLCAFTNNMEKRIDCFKYYMV